MGTGVRRNQLILSSNVAYWLLFFGLLLLGFSQYLRLSASTNVSEEYFRRLGSVGPFPVAETTLCDHKTSEADCLLRNAPRFDGLEVANLPRQPDLIVLIGSADRRSLSTGLRRYYDSNAGERVPARNLCDEELFCETRSLRAVQASFPSTAVRNSPPPTQVPRNWAATE